MKIAALFKMSVVNSILKEIHFKILYWGPKNAGKRSSLNYISSHSDPKKIFFTDLGLSEQKIRFLIINIGTVLGFKIFFHVLNMPDGMEEEMQQFLTGVDGVVFVADSHPDSEEENKKSLKFLDKGLQEHSKDIFKTPLAFQYNKRDLNPKISLEILRASLNKYNNRDFESSLLKGAGFMEPFKHVCRSILMTLKSGEIP